MLNVILEHFFLNIKFTKKNEWVMSPNPYQSETLGYAVGLKDLRRKSSRV